jgi:uncharacterized protein (DUF2141 family)
MHLIPAILYSFSLFGILTTPADSSDHVLVVRLTGFESLEGIARFAIFDDETFWAEEIEHSVRRLSSAVVSDTVTITVEDLPPGDYSIAAFHDEDGDAVFDRGLFGIPKERYGFSNNVRGSTGPPDFYDAMFSFDSDTLFLTILLE